MPKLAGGSRKQSELAPVKRVALLMPLLVALPARADPAVSENCAFDGIPLKGKVQIVESFADIEVKVVDSFPDLKVKTVSSFPDDCGEWEFVESFPDFTIKYVDSFADVEIQFVESFPGLP